MRTLLKDGVWLGGVTAEGKRVRGGRNVVIDARGF